MDIPQALNSISRAVELADKLRKLAAKSQNVELVEVITELRLELAGSKNALADVTEKVAALKNEARRLREYIQKLEVTSQLDAELIVKGSLYYKLNGEGPYCNGCYDTKKQLVRMNNLMNVGYKCPACRSFCSK